MTAMKTGNTFTNEVVTAGTKHTVAWVAGLMEQNNIGAVVITEQQRPVGVVTDRDIALPWRPTAFPPPTASAT